MVVDGHKVPALPQLPRVLILSKTSPAIFSQIFVVVSVCGKPIIPGSPTVMTFCGFFQGSF